MKEQFIRFGKVFPPKRESENAINSNFERPLKQTGQHVRIIKNILYQLVR
jgi:hypothetical protein